MSNVKRLLFAILIGTAFLLSGARQAPTPPAETTKADFVPQPIPLSPSIPLAGPALLHAAFAALESTKVPWMKTTIWQQMAERDLTFVAQAELLLGPHGCARLDMTIHTAMAISQHLVVSDGHALAQYTRNTKQADDMQGLPFPRGVEMLEAEKQDQVRETFLREKGCGGPRAVLFHLAQGIKDIQIDTGLWRGVPSLRLQGIVVNPQTAPAQVCCHLNADTLWPMRLEWRRLTRKGPAPFAYLQMEFRDPVLNQPLSFEECSRVFTFQPVDHPD